MRKSNASAAPLRTIDLPGELSAAIDFVREHRERLRRELLSCAGLLLRGAPLRSAEDVEQLASILEPTLRSTNPLDDTPRPWFSRHVYGAQEDPPAMLIPLHQEDSYLPRIPTAILFACLEAPDVGGETVVADCRGVLRALPEELRARLLGTTVRVRKRFGLSELALSTQGATIQEIEQMFRAYGGADGLEVDDDAAFVTSTVPAVIRHPETGEDILFGRLHFSWAGFLAHYHYALRFMDRAELDPATIAHWAELTGLGPEIAEHFFTCEPALAPEDAVVLNRVMWEHATAVQWRAGDLLYLDNRIAVHGRLPYRGARSIVVCSTEPEAVVPSASRA